MTLVGKLFDHVFASVQERIPRHRDKWILRSLDEVARRYHFAFENLNYSHAANGERNLLRRLRDSGNLKCIFDVGANTGEYALEARKVSRDTRIVSIEPVPDTFEKLLGNISSAGVEAYCCALGSSNCTSTIYLPENSEIASLLEDLQHFAKRSVCPVEIEMRTGKSLLEEDMSVGEISLLKVDTEGYESEVLKGFGSCLDCVNVIQFEYGRANLFSRYFLYDYFADYHEDWFIGKLYPMGVLFYECYNWNMEDFIGPNLIMVNRSKPEYLRIAA